MINLLKDDAIFKNDCNMRNMANIGTIDYLFVRLWQRVLHVFYMKKMFHFYIIKKNTEIWNNLFISRLFSETKFPFSRECTN